MLDVVVQAEEVGIKKTIIQDGLEEEEEDGVVSCFRDGELLLLPLFSDSAIQPGNKLPGVFLLSRSL